jgi:hypothetical protein
MRDDHIGNNGNGGNGGGPGREDPFLKLAAMVDHFMESTTKQMLAAERVADKSMTAIEEMARENAAMRRRLARIEAMLLEKDAPK